MQAPCRIDDHGIVAHAQRVFHSLFRGLGRGLRALFKHFGIGFAAHDFELVDRGGTVNIARDEQRFFALFFKLKRKFSA